MSNQQAHSESSEEKVLKSIKLSRIVLPVLLGIGVVVFLMFKQLDVEQFNNIKWNSHTLFWLSMAVLIYAVRHMLYAWRLREMTDKFFSWIKSIELIFIWEFSSAVSPTSFGGSAVALFLLAQEKISSAKTVSIVLYSMILDTIFFLISLPLLLIIAGPVIVRPELTSFALDGYLYSLFGIYLFILAYGIFFFYGLFISPQGIRSFLFLLSRIKILKRFRGALVNIGKDVVGTSNEIRDKNWKFHANCFIATSGAWICRFLAVNFIIIALLPETSLAFMDQFILYGRGEMMHTITQFSPTPGGSGVSELLFGGFYSDYISGGISFVVALIWRLVTYYPYLLIGAIIIPNWVRKLMNRRLKASTNA